MTSPSASSSLQRRLKPRTSGSGSGGGQSLSSSSSFHASISSPLASAAHATDDDDPFSSNDGSTNGSIGLPLPNGNVFNNGDTDSAPSSTYRPTSPATNRHRREGLSPFVSLLDTDLRSVSSPRAVPRSTSSLSSITDEPSPAISISVNGSANGNGMTPPGSSPVLASPKLPVMMPIEEEDKGNGDETFDGSQAQLSPRAAAAQLNTPRVMSFESATPNAAATNAAPHHHEEDDDTSLRLDEASELLALLMESVIRHGSEPRDLYASVRPMTPRRPAPSTPTTSSSDDASKDAVATPPAPAPPPVVTTTPAENDMTLVDMVREVIPHVIDLITHAKISASTQLRAAHLQKSVSQTLASRKPKNQEEEEVLKWISQDFSSRRRSSSIDRFAARPTTGISLVSSQGMSMLNHTTPSLSSSSSSTSVVPTLSLTTSNTSSSSSSTSSESSPRSPLKSPRNSGVGERALSFVNKLKSKISDKVQMSSKPILKLMDSLRVVNNTLLSNKVQACLATACTWEFDVFELNKLTDGRPLSTLMCWIMKDLGLFARFKIPQSVFAMFITTIEDGYHDVSYHNRVHAADVVQNVYFLLRTKSFPALLTSDDIFACLLGAAIHDYQHPGQNNQFQVATSSDVAIRYNDRSVLENMHCAEAFSIMKREGHNIFESMTGPLQRELRESIIAMVMATDMKAHFAVVSELQAAVEKKRMKGEWFTASSRSDRLMVLETALHTADLANPAKPLTTCVEWAERVVAEFYVQGDEERKLGIPVSLMCDRHKPNLERSQIGFIDAIVKPLYVVFAQIVPELKQCVDLLASNRAYWQSRVTASTTSQAVTIAPASPAHGPMSPSSARTSPSVHSGTEASSGTTIPPISLLSPSSSSTSSSSGGGTSTIAPTSTSHSSSGTTFQFNPQTLSSSNSTSSPSMGHGHSSHGHPTPSSGGHAHAHGHGHGSTIVPVSVSERSPASPSTSLLSAALSERAAAMVAAAAATAPAAVSSSSSSSTSSSLSVAITNGTSSPNVSPPTSRSPSPARSYASSSTTTTPSSSASSHRVPAPIATSGPVSHIRDDDDLAFTVGSPVSTFSVHFPPAAMASPMPRTVTGTVHHSSRAASGSTGERDSSSSLGVSGGGNNAVGNEGRRVTFAPRSPGGSPTQVTRTLTGLFAARLAALRNTSPGSSMTQSAPNTPHSLHAYHGGGHQPLTPKASSSSSSSSNTTPPQPTSSSSMNSTSEILDAIHEAPSPVPPQQQPSSST